MSCYRQTQLYLSSGKIFLDLLYSYLTVGDPEDKRAIFPGHVKVGHKKMDFTVPATITIRGCDS